MTFENNTSSSSTPGVSSPNSSVSSGHVFTLPENSELTSFYSKYGNDLSKVAEGYRNMQSRYDKSKEYLPAENYSIPDGVTLPDATRQTLLNQARNWELSTKQFNKLVQDASLEYQKSIEKTEQAKNLRSVALGGNDGESALKTFYADKLPPAAIEKIFNDGSIETLQELKNFRDKSMNSSQNLNSEASDPLQGGNPVSDLYDIKNRYFKVSDDFEKSAKKYGYSHPEVQKLGLQQEELLKVYQNHVLSMEKAASKNFSGI